MHRNIAELLGTFGLVLIGPGAIVLGFSHFWISFCFGVIVMLMILIFGKISGAHINPAVSIAFYVKSRERYLLTYIPYQLIGALIAGLILWLAIPDNPTYGETRSSGALYETFLIEVFITCILMLSILWIIRFNNLLLTAFVVGFVVFLAAYFAGPFTGASMNPARSFGPAIVSMQFTELWLYFLAPVFGAMLAVWIMNFLEKVKPN